MKGKIYNITDNKFKNIIDESKTLKESYEKCKKIVGKCCYKSMRKRINDLNINIEKFKQTKIDKITDDLFTKFVNDSKSYKELLKKCGYISNGKSANKNFKNIIDNRIAKLNLTPIYKFGTKNYTLDEDSFNKLNRDTTWVLGLIFSDGSINSTNQVNITSTDLIILQKVEKILQGKYLIHNKKKYKETEKDSWVLRFTSKKISDLLKKSYNLHKNKDFTIIFPHINSNLIWDFIRGFFDGDGCITKNGKWFICSASQTFINQLHIKMKTLGCDKIYTTNYHIPKVETGRYDQIKYIYENMYKNTSNYLPRKKHTFEYYLFSCKRRKFSKELIIPEWFFS